MRPIGQTNIGPAGPKEADHHRLDHIEGEQGSDGRIDGITANSQHLDSGRRAKGIVCGDHTPRAAGGLLFKFEVGASFGTPGGWGCHRLLPS